MIRLQARRLASVEDAWSALQTAIGVEFGTLPPYLYAMWSIPQGRNVEAAGRIKSVTLQEMIHMCLACNILNALGGSPLLKPPSYPGPLPGDIGPGRKPLTIRLLKLSPESMAQAMAIEMPEKPLKFPVRGLAAAQAVTIGEFYDRLDKFLKTLPASAWTPHRNQIDDSQFFAGQLFPINDYADAHKAISQIVSEGEGASDSPLDFQHEVSHYYRFGEIYHNKVLTKMPEPPGYSWGPESLGVDWDDVHNCIPDPCTHDFSNDPPAARAAQNACNAAYSAMVDHLQAAMNGDAGGLGQAVRAMFELRMAAFVAVTTPLANPDEVAGPSFVYQSGQTGGGA